MSILAVCMFTLAGLEVVSILMLPSRIGKPRAPITSRQAAIQTAACLLFAVMYVLTAIVLMRVA